MSCKKDEKIEHIIECFKARFVRQCQLSQNSDVEQERRIKFFNTFVRSENSYVTGERESKPKNNSRTKSNKD